ncbi:polyphosphate kinase [Gillisia sp. Hel_I_86]|uniref:polyphosphate kinase n=1 Tax=Gillisia sp. Hel_I_86 TaxID=1249981 RepID=UPI001C93C84F|nr:polyphosphate kinase [Gillisia sp. Hel_I_86]
MTKLKNIPTFPAETFFKKECEKELKKIKKGLFSLQNKFYADGRYGLLIILQGIDTSGKDGTAHHAFSSMIPKGVHVTSFKAPIGREPEHDFLWRIYPYIPGKSRIGVFNRSYYENILVPALNESLRKEDIQHRCQLINELEDHLIRNNIHVLKSFLHIYEEEQKKKPEERKTNPSKKWKYSVADSKAPAELKENTYTW